MVRNMYSRPAWHVITASTEQSTLTAEVNYDWRKTRIHTWPRQVVYFMWV